MTDRTTATPPAPGRRRADFPAIGQTVEATRPADPWDEPQRERVSAIPAALDHTSDELNRLEGILVNLDSRVGDLAERLSPVLTMGIPAPMDDGGAEVPGPTPEDHRSTIAQAISTRAANVRRAGDYADRIAARVSAILEHVEA